MLNKKKVAIVIGIAILIIILIIGLVVISNSGGSKITKLYNNLEESQVYLFSMKNEDDYEITISKKNEQTSIDMNNAGEITTTLIKDGVTYLIIHSNKEYYVYDSDITEENIITDMLEGLVDVDYEKGKEKINNKNYRYEEYTGFAGFMTSTSIDVDGNDVKTRFYFDGDELVYIKTIFGDEEELLEVNISYEVDDSVFEIPSDYAEAN